MLLIGYNKAGRIDGELVGEARQLLIAQQEKKRSGLMWQQSFDLPMLYEWMHLTRHFLAPYQDKKGGRNLSLCVP